MAVESETNRDIVAGFIMGSTCSTVYVSLVLQKVPNFERSQYNFYGILDFDLMCHNEQYSKILAIRQFNVP